MNRTATEADCVHVCLYVCVLANDSSTQQQCAHPSLSFLIQEMADLAKSPPPGITAGPINDDMFHWSGKKTSLEGVEMDVLEEWGGGNADVLYSTYLDDISPPLGTIAGPVSR